MFVAINSIVYPIDVKGVGIVHFITELIVTHSIFTFKNEPLFRKYL